MSLQLIVIFALLLTPVIVVGIGIGFLKYWTKHEQDKTFARVKRSARPLSSAGRDVDRGV